MIGEPDRVKEADAPRRCAAQRSCAAALRAVGYAKDTPEPLVDPCTFWRTGRSHAKILGEYIAEIHAAAPSRSRDGGPSTVLLQMRRGCAVAALCLTAAPPVARADGQTSTPQRPAIMFNRWQEDWEASFAMAAKPWFSATKP